VLELRIGAGNRKCLCREDVVRWLWRRGVLHRSHHLRAVAAPPARPPEAAWPSLVKLIASGDRMRVNVGQAKTDLSKLLARVEAGEEVEIARNGVPVARLVKVHRESHPGKRFLALRGIGAGEIRISDDFEFTDEELDELFYNSP
jgi:prevent-host-death family protein